MGLADEASRRVASVAMTLEPGWELSEGGQALRCKAIPFAHGFSTRLGGVSTGAFATLNLAADKSDDPAAVTENRRRFAAAAGLSGAWLALDQVHGSEVVVVSRADLAPDARGDALATATPGLPIAAQVADCVPVLLADIKGRAVAAVHSGWRGTVAGVLPAAILALTRLGVDPADIVAAIGPAARKCCYEVGDEVVAALEETSPPTPVDDREGWLGQGPRRWHVDLPVVLRRQLRVAGIRPDNIHDAGLCTICRGDLVFSYRRDGLDSGRMVAAIELSR